MTNQASLWNLEEGKRLRDKGMARVLSHTELGWRGDFERVFHELIMQGRDITAEDVTARVGMPPSHVNPNAVGALFRGLCVRHRLTKVGRVKAQRASRHANEIVVWGKR